VGMKMKKNYGKNVRGVKKSESGQQCKGGSVGNLLSLKKNQRSGKQQSDALSLLTLHLLTFDILPEWGGGGGGVQRHHRTKHFFPTYTVNLGLISIKYKNTYNGSSKISI
jgi:hypothetical protein